MLNTKVLIDTVEKVKEFSAILSKEEVDCELIQGIHILDAKSIMGIFTLDIKNPIELHVHSDDQSILNKIESFIYQD